MSTLLLLQGYNNYFNRVVKFHNTVAEYKQYTYHEVEANFNPNDGVDTEHIFNSTNISPDYLVVYEDNIIKSRWFVLEWVRTRVGQYKASLKRDVKADLYNVYIDAPAYIERAMVDANNPLIYNSEGGSYNQIKTSETLIGEDKGWIVGYISKSAGDLSWSIAPQGAYIDINTTLENWKFYGYNVNAYKAPLDTGDYMFKYLDNVSETKNRYKFTLRISGSKSNAKLDTHDVVGNYLSSTSGSTYITIGQALTTAINNYSLAALNSKLKLQIYGETEHTATDLSELMNYNGSTIKTSDNKLYKITVIAVQSTVYNDEAEGDVLEAMQSIAYSTNILLDTMTKTKPYQLYYSHKNYLVQYVEIPNSQYSGTTSNTRWKCDDSPLYDMFAIPYNNTVVYGKGTTNKEVSIAIATSIAQGATSSKCFDLQLLPYCPIREYVIGSGTLVLDADDANKGWQEVKINNQFATVILYPTKSNISFTIDLAIAAHSNPVEIKVANETDVYRLISPNGQGAFEFSVEKNGGVSYFDVDLTYKPYSPYIHIAPHFNKMYGQDFNDFRGLNCGGDFSFGTLNDAWANYELTSKNYQNVFNREIQNMDFNYKYSMIESGINALTSAGTMVAAGGKLGGIPGGAVAGGLSLAAGITDLFINEKKYNETVDFKKDMFGFSLGNIKALPTTISKTSALTANNKILPYIEYYTATDVEKDILKNNITYSSMSVGAVGNISSYLNDDEQFVKAVLIKLPNIIEDTHMAQELYGELAKGAYFK